MVMMMEAGDEVGELVGERGGFWFVRRIHGIHLQDDQQLLEEEKEEKVDWPQRTKKRNENMGNKKMRVRSNLCSQPHHRIWHMISGRRG